VPDTDPIRESRGRLELLAQVASLVATAWIVWNVTAVRGTAFRLPASTVWLAVDFTLLAWVWSAAVALALQFAIRRVERVDLAGATLRTSLVAVWFAPATLLLYRFSAATVAAALVLVVNATRLLYTQWRVVSPVDELALPVSGTAILLGDGGMPPPILTRHLGPALTVAAGLQFGIAAALFHDHFLAGALLTLTVAVLTVFAISSGAWEPPRPPTLPRSIFGVLLTVALAAGLTILAGGGGAGGGGSSDSGREGDEASSRPLGDFLVGAQPPPAAPRTGLPGQTQPAPDDMVPGAGDVAGSFPGVILWPEIQPVTRLIAPLPVRPGALAASRNPYGIPFGGEYWFFRMWYSRPPQRSVIERGTPWKIAFSTTDHWPLNMEAHQKLDQPIEVSCCSRIQVAVSNADRYPHTVSLELILRDPSGRGSQSLGTVPVTSVPNLDADPVIPVSETLDFAMPPKSRVRTFNEMTVIFRRDYKRGFKSARVAIERFILIPRGR
jgi:hypothetical protein